MGISRQFHTYFSEISLQEIDESRRGSLIGASISQNIIAYAKNPRKSAKTEIRLYELEAIYAGLQQVVDSLRTSTANDNYSRQMEELHRGISGFNNEVPKTMLRLFPRIVFAMINMPGPLESRVMTFGSRLERNVFQRGPLSVPSASFAYDNKSLEYATEVAKK